MQSGDGAAGGARQQHLPPRHAGGRGLRGRPRDGDGPEEAARTPAPGACGPRCAAWRPAACLLARPLADHGAHSVDAMARTEMWRVIGTCSTGAGALMQAH